MVGSCLVTIISNSLPLFSWPCLWDIAFSALHTKRIASLLRCKFKFQLIKGEFPWCVTLQPLSIFTSSLAVAENMADLIDGYCRLESISETSLIVRPNKGTFSYKFLKCVHGYTFRNQIYKVLWELCKMHCGLITIWSGQSAFIRESHKTKATWHPQTVSVFISYHIIISKVLS